MDTRSKKSEPQEGIGSIFIEYFLKANHFGTGVVEIDRGPTYHDTYRKIANHTIADGPETLEIV